MKIATVIGARPQFIKAAAISRYIGEYNKNNPSNNIEEILIHTGQHYDNGMSAIFFKELEIPEPKYNLNIGSGPHGFQTGRMLIAIEEVFIKEKPDWVLIYGDTNSTLAGAVAAAKLHIPIAHVEAGLRSFNRLMPEEINRIIADQLSCALLCPSQTAISNLALEGINKGVYLTGDVMANALQFAVTKASFNTDILTRLNIDPQKYLLATVHRAENTDDINRLRNILSAFELINEVVVFPAHPRTRNLLHKMGYQPPRHLKLTDPVGYFEIIALQKSARLILTDSGGMQKEAYWLKVPCITLRNETEWVETVNTGWNMLVGAERDRIINAVNAFSSPLEHPPLYGEGKAVENCLKALFK
jgi:UDP-GlcNAc3NAcA epimerase